MNPTHPGLLKHSVVCEYHQNCKIYDNAIAAVNLDRASEDNIEQLLEICDTDARFSESCFRSKREGVKQNGSK